MAQREGPSATHVLVSLALAACASGLAFALGARRAHRELVNAKQIYMQEKAARQRAEALNIQRTFVTGNVNLPFIGTIRTMFPKRFGTPRQGALAESTTGIIELDKQVLGIGALDGLESYSHAWLLFYFHINTDESKMAVAGEGKTFKGRIKPPGMLGAKTGVLSTRSPHRPSRLGLSLVKIERVESEARRLVVSGVDLVDKTPIFDIKPFVPADVPVGQVLYPDWVGNRAKDGQSESAPLLVDFSQEACVELGEILNFSEYAQMFLTKDVAKAVDIISQALRLDVRAVYHGRYSTSERTFFAQFCDIGVHFEVKDMEGERPRLVVTKCERMDVDS